MQHILDLFRSYLPEPHASLMNGILLGVPLETTLSFQNKLKIVGLMHIVVLSGMNITILSSIVLSTSVRFIGRKYAILCTIVIICLFIKVVGVQPPVIRAAIMGITSLIGLLLGRKTISLYTLCVSAIIMLVIWPQWLFSISFQLSFAATFGIILFSRYEETTKVTEQSTMIKSVMNYIYEEFRLSASAQMFTAPILFYYFRQISFISPLANILVSWLISPLMIIGISNDRC
jgi:competence protein ComEC